MGAQPVSASRRQVLVSTSDERSQQQLGGGKGLKDYSAHLEAALKAGKLDREDLRNIYTVKSQIFFR